VRSHLHFVPVTEILVMLNEVTAMLLRVTVEQSWSRQPFDS